MILSQEPCLDHHHSKIPRPFFSVLAVGSTSSLD